MKVYLATMYLLGDDNNSSYEEDVGVFYSRDDAVAAAIQACAKANKFRHSYDYWVRCFEVQ